MKDYEALLEEHNFFRLHNSHIINLNDVAKFIRSDGGYVIMSDGSSVPVSRARKDEFLHRVRL